MYQNGLFDNFENWQVSGYAPGLVIGGCVSLILRITSHWLYPSPHLSCMVVGFPLKSDPTLIYARSKIPSYPCFNQSFMFKFHERLLAGCVLGLPCPRPLLRT